MLEASSGEEALAVWAAHAGVVQVLLTDMVMPGTVSGRELAARLMTAAPDLKVIYMSGYSVDLSLGTLARGPQQQLLEKPFTVNDLMRAVRRCLEHLPGG